MNRDVFRFAFGPLTVEITAADELAPVVRTLEAWFEAGRLSHASVADLRFELVPPGTAADGTGPTEWDGRAWEAGPGARRDSEPTRSWRLSLRDGPLLRTVGRLPRPLFRFLHVHRFDTDELRASTFLYRHLVPAVQAALLERGATLVHASALLGPDGSGLVISGRGGSGKTSGSAALYLGGPSHWSFMSDDLAVLDRDGVVHFSPLPLNIFPYSTRTFPPLHEKVVRPMDPADRFQWRVRGRVMGAKGVARRITPWQAPEDARTCPLGLFVHLERSTVSEPVVEPAGAVTAARTCGSILRHELRAGLPLYGRTTAGAEAGDGAIEALATAGEAVIATALRGVPVLVATVPPAMPVRELGDLLESLWGRHRTGGSAAR